jgi:hypothetical protein
MDSLNTFFAGDLAKMEAFLHLYSGRFPLKSKCPPGITAIEAVKALLLVDGLEDAARDDVKKHTEEWAASKGPAVATLTSTSTQGLDGADLTQDGGGTSTSLSPSLSFSLLTQGEDQPPPPNLLKQGPAKRPSLCRSIWKGTTCKTETSGCTFAHPRPCHLQTCNPKRDFRCTLWHGRSGKLAAPKTNKSASGNFGGGRGKPPSNKNPNNTKNQNCFPNGRGLGLRDLQNRLAMAEKDKQMSDLRLEVQRLKHKAVPKAQQRSSFAAAAAAPSRMSASVDSSMASSQPGASLSFPASTQVPAPQQPTLDLAAVLAKIQLQLQQQKMQIALLVSKQ